MIVKLLHRTLWVLGIVNEELSFNRLVHVKHKFDRVAYLKPLSEPIVQALAVTRRSAERPGRFHSCCINAITLADRYLVNNLLYKHVKSLFAICFTIDIQYM